MDNTNTLMRVAENPAIDQVAEPLSKAVRGAYETNTLSATASRRPDGRDDSASVSGLAPEPSESRMNRIARRAQEIYEHRGGEYGKAVEDWLQAEREIDAGMEASRTQD
jgi:hypothetical protein